MKSHVWVLVLHICQSMHSSLLSWRELFWKNLEIKFIMRKTESLVKWPIVYPRHIKNSVNPHGNHMFQTASGMAMATMCEYPSSKYALPHWKCVLSCCAQCPRIYLPSPESYQHNSNVISTILFMCINTLHVLLWMSDALLMKIKSVGCLRLLQMQL